MKPEMSAKPVQLALGLVGGVVWQPGQLKGKVMKGPALGSQRPSSKAKNTNLKKRTKTVTKLFKVSEEIPANS